MPKIKDHIIIPTWGMENIFKKYKRGDKMNIVEITPQSVGDLKQVLQDQDITQNSLRISVNIG